MTSESYCDRPTWSPAPFNEIAYAARTGPGLRHQGHRPGDAARSRQLTFGEGTNESPAFSPNGRHIAFTSTRAGKTQIFTMARDGKDLRQITQSRQQLPARLVEMTGRSIDDEERRDARSRSTPAARWSLVARRGGRLRQEEAAGRAADAAAAAPTVGTTRRASAGAARAGRRADRSCRPSRCATTRSRRRRSTT